VSGVFVVPDVPGVLVIITISSMLTISILLTICTVLIMGSRIHLSVVVFSGGMLGFLFHE
jgi:hypothetical protein